MRELEKLQVLLPHWIQHNEEHAEESRKWAKRAHVAKADIIVASQQLEVADQFVRLALEKLERTSSVAQGSERSLKHADT